MVYKYSSFVPLSSASPPPSTSLLSCPIFLKPLPLPPFTPPFACLPPPSQQTKVYQHSVHNTAEAYNKLTKSKEKLDATRGTTRRKKAQEKQMEVCAWGRLVIITGAPFLKIHQGVFLLLIQCPLGILSWVIWQAMF